MWFDKGGIENQVGAPDSSQIIGFHQTGGDNESEKQGYSFPIIPGIEHSYKLSLTSGNGDIPLSWVLEFSDLVIGNRYSIEYTNLSLNGKDCGSFGGLISSHHGRHFIWSGDSFMHEAWGNTGACAEGPLEQPVHDCSLNNGVLSADECPELCNNMCNEENSYCDCGSATCKCKPGNSGSNCSIDVCAAASCGEHGSCSVKYLGGSLPANEKGCICDDGWTGPQCQYNPCKELDKSCSGNGSCVAITETEAHCQCNDGFTGENCQDSCNGICQGEYPFGCAINVDGAVRYGCHVNGGCSYLEEGEDYPFDGFCTFKSLNYQPTPAPVKQPTPAPTSPFVSSVSPTMPATLCGCASCTQQVWSTVATDDGGSYTCGARITWLQTALGKTEYNACAQVGNEFPSLCGSCRPGTCVSNTTVPSKVPTPAPSSMPTISPSSMASSQPSIMPSSQLSLQPSSVPSLEPSRNPSSMPTLVPSKKPSKHPIVFYCGCPSCSTETVWNTLAADQSGSHTCGARITWLQDALGFSEFDACSKVSAEEFHDVCGPCDPELCNNVNFPTLSPSKALDAPSSPPSDEPSTEPIFFCDCLLCTTDIWNALATDDKSGSHTCGARITWLQDARGYSEPDACSRVSAEEFPDVCGPCDPALCRPGGLRGMK
jgi:hypothetical protein